jgi:hypothetical protein
MRIAALITLIGCFKRIPAILQALIHKSIGKFFEIINERSNRQLD